MKAGIKKQRMSSTTSTDDAVSTVPLSSLSLNTITEEESKKITVSQKGTYAKCVSLVKNLPEFNISR